MNLGRPPDSLRATLRQRNAAKLACLDVLSEGLNGVFDRDAGVDSGALEDVEGFGGAENT